MSIKRPTVGSTYESFTSVLSISDDELSDEFAEVPLKDRILLVQYFVWKQVMLSAVMQGTMTADEFRERILFAKNVYASLVSEDYLHLLEYFNAGS